MVHSIEKRKEGYDDPTNHSLCQFGGTFIHQSAQRGAAAGAVGVGLQKVAGNKRVQPQREGQPLQAFTQ